VYSIEKVEMEEIFNSISRILSEKPGNRIDFKRHIVADDGEEIDGIELLQYYFPKPAEIILWFYDNTKPLKDYSEDTIQRIYKKVKRYDRKTLPKQRNHIIKTNIDFKLDDKGKCSEFCFNDYNEQEYLIESFDTMSDGELINLLERFVNDQFIKPKRCKGIIKIRDDGTLELKFRYYSKNSHLLEKEIYKKMIPIGNW